MRNIFLLITSISYILASKPVISTIDLIEKHKKEKTEFYESYDKLIKAFERID